GVARERGRALGRHPPHGQPRPQPEIEQPALAADEHAMPVGAEGGPLRADQLARPALQADAPPVEQHVHRDAANSAITAITRSTCSSKRNRSSTCALAAALSRSYVPGSAKSASIAAASIAGSTSRGGAIASAAGS